MGANPKAKDLGVQGSIAELNKGVAILSGVFFLDYMAGTERAVIAIDAKADKRWSFPVELAHCVEVIESEHGVILLSLGLRRGGRSDNPTLRRTGEKPELRIAVRRLERGGEFDRIATLGIA